MLSDFFADSPDFYQLDFGTWLSNRDAVSIEALTWKYDEPLGIPYGSSKGAPDEAYPGHVKEYGLGIGYEHLAWHGVYTSVHALPLLQRYFDERGAKIRDGFELYLTLRAGYHLDLLHDRFFVEPSVAFNYWPIRTDAPAAFAVKDREWPNYFLFEPGLNVGVDF